jgi:uncharacterized protein (DUF1778 family)
LGAGLNSLFCVVEMYGWLPYNLPSIKCGERLKMSRIFSQKSSEKAERLEARISVEQKKLFQQAASLQGRTLTEFVIDSVREKAESVIREQELMTLGARDRKVFIHALLAAPAPGKKLRIAAERYLKEKVRGGK